MAKITFEEKLCKGCELCVDACPKKILALSSCVNEKGYHIAECTDMAQCTACQSCARMCPDCVITIER